MVEVVYNPYAVLEEGVKRRAKELLYEKGLIVNTIPIERPPKKRGEICLNLAVLSRKAKVEIAELVKILSKTFQMQKVLVTSYALFNYKY